MKTLTIRGIDPELDRAIKSRAQQNNLSTEPVGYPGIEKVTGTGREPVFKKHHDLDARRQVEQEETTAFRKNTKIFERIDEDIWK